MSDIEGYEAWVELESVHFLKVVNEPGKEGEALTLAKALVGRAISQTSSVLAMSASGNYGLALHTMLICDLKLTSLEKSAAVLIGYWALTNHIEWDEIPLLVYNRANLMFASKGLLTSVYKQAVSEQYSPYSIDLSIAIAGAESAIHDMLIYDMFSINDLLPEANGAYRYYASKLNSASDNFRHPSYYASKHALMNSKIKSMFIN